MKRTIRDPAVKLADWFEEVGNPNCQGWTTLGANPEPLDTSDPIIVDPLHEFHAPNDQDDPDIPGFDLDQVVEKFGEFTYRGRRKDGKEEGVFHGGGRICFENKDELMGSFENGVKHGEVVIISPRKNIARLCATYENGLMQGAAKIVS